MLVEAAVSPIHNATISFLVGHIPQRTTRPLTRPQHLTAASVLRLPCGAALSVLVEAAIGPALAVLVKAALGPIHSAALVEAALGPIHSAALVKTALGPTALVVLVEAALGPIHSAAIHGAVLRRNSQDGARPACACRAV